MISFAIEAARESRLFDRILVSTDDGDILRIAEQWGAVTPFLRPAELSDDHTPTAPVVAHAVRECEAGGIHVDEVCCIYPCVPFLQVEDLAAGLQKLHDSGASFSFPVAEYPSAIQRALRLDRDGRTSPFHPEFEAVRTQDLEPAYYDAGQFYWGRRDAWLTEANIHSNGSGFVIPSWRVVDIDTPEDWDRAEKLWRTLHPSAGTAGTNEQDAATSEENPSS